MPKLAYHNHFLCLFPPPHSDFKGEFLNAFSHHYKRVGPLDRPSVGTTVTLFFSNSLKCFLSTVELDRKPREIGDGEENEKGGGESGDGVEEGLVMGEGRTPRREGRF